MMLEFYSKNKKILLAISVLILLVGIVYLIFANLPAKPEPEQVFCALDAKLCPDGSYVGRSGPKCEFSACPEISNEFGWKTFTDYALGVSFQYPDSFGTKYMHALDWPPQIAVINETYSCIEAGSEIERAGRTETRVINGRNYCVTTIAEGAAGSIYTQYAYALAKGEKTVIFTFSVRATQCGNYNEAQKIECENERASFGIDYFIDRIVRTLRFN